MPIYRPYQGEVLVIPHVFTNLDTGDPIDLSGYSVWWTLKANVADADAQAAINHYWSESSEFGLSLTDPESLITLSTSAGILYNKISGDETRALSPSVTYVCDLWIRDPNGLDRPLERGRLTVRRAVRDRTNLAP